MGSGFLGKSEKNGRVLKSLLDRCRGMMQTEEHGKKIADPKGNRRTSGHVREGTSYAYLQKSLASL